MDQRYSLRFESGERRGETVPIPPAGLTVGRKPGNTLQVLDNSVSGQHAVLEVAGDVVRLRDLGSTNGTRVQNERALEVLLSSGDTIHFGNVRFTFHDARARSGAEGGIELEGFDEVSPAESALSATTVTPGVEGLARISAEHIAEAKKRSFVGPAALVLLVGAGAGLWWWFQRGGPRTDADAAAVVPVEGNLLAGYSFEGEDETWVNADGTPAAFVRSGAARRSGAFGVETELEGEQWASYRSRPVRVAAGRVLAARGFLRVRGACDARVGIEFLGPDIADTPALGSAIAWSDVVAGGGDYRGVEVQCAVPGGRYQARVVVLARAPSKDAGGGAVAADDVCLVPGAGDGRPSASVPDADLFLLGEAAPIAQLGRADRVFVTGLCFTKSAEGATLDAVPMSARAEGARFGLEARAEAAALTLRVEEPLARARVATIGRDGYRARGVDFESDVVTTLLFGSGTEMLRIQLGSPAAVRGTAEGGATRIVITPASKLEMQLDFAAERKEAGNVAHAARGAEQRGELGEAIAKWEELLSGFPYEDALVDEAETARTRLVQKGLAELRATEAQVERARFFRLADLFKECRQDALALAKRYEKSEIEVEAKKLVVGITNEIGALEVDQNKAERERMRGILAALEASGATTLAAEVRRYLTEKLGDRN